MLNELTACDPLSLAPCAEVSGTIYAAESRPDVPQRRIFVVEDTSDLAALLAEQLKIVARDVSVCGNGRSALAKLQHDSFDLIILDIGLPGMSGLEVCRAIRAAEISTPILMLTARASELDRIVGLEFGADDYMVKPFSVLELQARVRAIFRRCDLRRAPAMPAADDRLAVGSLVIRPAARLVLRGKENLPLTEKEFDLLHLLAGNPGRVYTRSQLLDHVWGHGSEIFEYSVTSHINRLRAKIEADPAHPRIIETVWGVGYRLHAGLGTVPAVS